MKQIYDDNLQEAKESEKLTDSSYWGESHYTEGGNLNYKFEKGVILRDPKTAGMKMYYPHGVISSRQSGERKMLVMGFFITLIVMS